MYNVYIYVLWMIALFAEFSIEHIWLLRQDLPQPKSNRRTQKKKKNHYLNLVNILDKLTLYPEYSYNWGYDFFPYLFF